MWFLFILLFHSELKARFKEVIFFALAECLLDEHFL